MVRRNKTVPTVIRKRKAKPQRSRNRSTRAVLPPAKSIMGHIMRSVVQTAWDIAQGALTISESHSNVGINDRPADGHPVFTPTTNPTSWSNWNLTLGWLLAQGWLDRFKGLFKQVKVHRITAHFMPYESIAAPGEYVFALWDKDEDAGPTTFSEAIGMPASVVRKNGQPARLVWYPTEPDDRNWIMLTDANHVFASSYLCQAEQKYNVDVAGKPATNSPEGQVIGVEGKVIIEVDASFRGKPTKPATYEQSTLCACRKCLRRLVPRLMRASTQGSTSPFSAMDEYG